RPLTLEDDVLVLSYPATASFSKRKIEDRANGERLSQALRLVFAPPLGARVCRLVPGGPPRARFEIRDSEGDDHPGSAVRLTEDELIARFKSEFDAEDLADQHAGETAAAAEEN